MKPIRLEVRGLQSYVEPVVVDFDALGRYGLFGIFGPIGSGKSSLLDAMTLALYGLVDRVAGRSKKGVINADSDRMEVRLRFSVRSAGHAEQYEVHRAYRLVDGSAQRIASRLVQHTEHGQPCDPPLVLADKEREVNDSVSSIVGLCAEDFMRAVVLPQGRFRDVLHLKGSERRGMLQRIFRLSAYGAQLRQSLRGRQQARREVLAAIDGELQGLGPASAAAVRQAATAQSEAVEARRVATTRVEAARRTHDAAALARRTHEQLASARDALVRLEAAAPEMNQRQQLLAAAEHLLPQRRPAARWRTSRERLALAHERQRTASAQAEAAAQQAQNAQNAYVDAKGAYDRRTPGLQSRLAALEGIAKRLAADHAIVERVEEAVATTTRLRERRRSIDAGIDEARDELRVLDPRRRALRRRLAKERVTLEERRHVATVADAHQRLATARSAHEVAVDEQHRAEDAAKAAESAQAELQEAWKLCAASTAQLAASLATAPSGVAAESAALRELGEERIDAHSGALARREAALERLRAAATDLAATRGAHERQRMVLSEEEARHQLEQAKRRDHERATLTARLAAELRNDEPCVVCGSIEHPSPATAPPDADPIEPSDLSEIRALAAEAKAQQAAAQARHTSMEEVLAEREAAVERTSHALCELLPGEPPTDVLEAARAAHREATEAARVHEAALEARGALEAELQEARLAEERALGPLRAATGELDRLRQTLATATEAVDEGSAAVGTAWAGWSEVAGAHTTLFDVPQLQRRLDVRDATARDLERELAEADARREVLLQSVSDLQAERSAAVADVTEAEARRERLAERLEALRADAERVLGEGPESSQSVDSLADPDAVPAPPTPADLGRHVRAATQAVNDERGALDKALEEAATHRERCTTAAADAAAMAAAANAAVDAATHDLGEAWSAWVELAPELQEYGDAPGRATPLSEPTSAALDAAMKRMADLPEAEDLTSWRQELDEHVRATQRVQARIEAFEPGEGPPPTDDALAALASDLEQALQEAERCTQVAAGARAAHDGLVERWARVQELQVRRSTTATELERLEHLGGLLRGDRFVEFVANDLLRELADTASRHLTTLSEGRYTLVLDGQGGFLVCDADAGGTTRPVTSLSGGESFLSALALALALSTQIQARGARPLEFFFLDEGFGSLDPEALDRVMSAIERLNDGQRIIGLISHVPGVQERIPMHLVVHPAGAQQRGSSVELRIH